MAKYSKTAQKSVSSAMKRMEKGTLRSGGSGKKVTNPKQAIAIGLSEAREKGAKVPKKKTAAKKPVTKQAPAKKAAPKKSPAKSAGVKKQAVKKPGAKKAAVTKKATPVKKSVPKKTATKNQQHRVKEKEDLVPDKMQQETGSHLPPVEEKSPAVVSGTPERMIDPITMTDKKDLAKAVAKFDPRHPIKLSGPKTTIRPSGKKPLWR